MTAKRTPAAGDSASTHEERAHDLTMHVFSISAAMVGVCLTAIGILRLIAAQTKFQTLGDDLLALDALLFGASCFLSFWSFKTRSARMRDRLRPVVDSLFMLALALMVVICGIIAWALV